MTEETLWGLSLALFLFALEEDSLPTLSLVLTANLFGSVGVSPNWVPWSSMSREENH